MDKRLGIGSLKSANRVGKIKRAESLQKQLDSRQEGSQSRWPGTCLNYTFITSSSGLSISPRVGDERLDQVLEGQLELE